MKSTTYYVSSLTGNDENDGLTPSTPFASLNKINEISLCAGDKVLLERGSVFEKQFLHIKGCGDYTQETLNALKAIGAHKTEDLMLRAVCKFKGGIVPRDMEERQDMVDELDEEDAWENLDDEYYDDKQYTIEILEMQYKYVMGNKHIFLSEF